MSEQDDDPKGTPSAKAAYAGEGYNQTYVIMSNKADDEAKGSNGNHQVFFRCGNWCYRGPIQFNGLKIETSTLPVLIPMLQRQQNSLKYYCTSKSLPPDSEYYDPVELLNRASDFIADEITSEHVEKELRKWSSVFPWIDDDSANCYFELVMECPEYMKDVALIASKTYTRGLVIISLFFDRTVYLLVQAGEGDQPLLDVRFPDVSKHGQGLHIASYRDTELWKKLTLWHILAVESNSPGKPVSKPRTVNLLSPDYIQTYCILKGFPLDNSSPIPKAISLDHDVLFRFGTWIYSGRVQLAPVLTLADIPYVIPALRLQQSKMDYLSDVSSLNASSPFAPALLYMQKILPVIENQIYQSEEALSSLIQRLARMGLGDSVQKWLEGEPGNSFFEFRVAPDLELERIFDNMELVASKCYHASGVVTVTVVFQYNIYVTVLEAGNENPLLDSRFPDVSGKGRGYQLQAFTEGIPGWPQLRKVSVWQTVSALEQEFRERTARLSQSKREKEAVAAEEKMEVRDDRPVSAKLAASGPSDDKLVLRNGATDGDLTDDEQNDDIALAKSVETVNEVMAEAKSKVDSKLAITFGAVAAGDTDVKRMSTARVGSPHVNSEADDSEHTPAVGALIAESKTAKATEGSTSESSSARTAPSMFDVRTAKPHHIPKLESITMAKKLEEMRKNMAGNEVFNPLMKFSVASYLFCGCGIGGSTLGFIWPSERTE